MAPCGGPALLGKGSMACSQNLRPHRQYPHDGTEPTGL
jgi:hypothetical protein